MQPHFSHAQTPLFLAMLCDLTLNFAPRLAWNTSSLARFRNSARCFTALPGHCDCLSFRHDCTVHARLPRISQLQMPQLCPMTCPPTVRSSASAGLPPEHGPPGAPLARPERASTARPPGP
eukprot:5468495-Alexandrium_andersonii.AAC.1